MITGRVDVAVYNKDHQLVLVVEAKSRFDATERWAGRTLRNRYVHLGLPPTPYFLLAVPDIFYLWKDPNRKVAGNPAAVLEEIPPDYAVPAWEIVRPYLSDGDIGPHDVSSYAMEMIANAWVADLLNSDLSRETAPPHLSWLFDSGLYEAMRGGYLASQALV